MKSITTVMVLGLVLGLSAAGCSQLGGGDAAATKVADEGRPALSSDEGQGTIALSEIPEAVRNAALGAMPGLVLTEAEREVEDGVTIYCVHGTVDGKGVEIEVSADGKVLDVEDGDDDDDDDDDDEEDDG